MPYHIATHQALNRVALTLAADVNGDASYFKCPLMAFHFLTRNVQAAFLLLIEVFRVFFPCHLKWVHFKSLKKGRRVKKKKKRSVVGLYSVINRKPFISKLSTIRYWK